MPIRQPSSAAQLYAWHRAAMAGNCPAQHDGLPECGWFKTRLVRGGPWVPVEIRVEREICLETYELLGPERLICICDGQRRNAARLWTYLTPISREEHKALANRATAIPAMAASMVAIDLTLEPVCP